MLACFCGTLNVVRRSGDREIYAVALGFDDNHGLTRLRHNADLITGPCTSVIRVLRILRVEHLVRK